jgi:hypothetical protein
VIGAAVRELRVPLQHVHLSTLQQAKRDQDVVERLVVAVEDVAVPLKRQRLEPFLQVEQDRLVAAGECTEGVLPLELI